MASNFEEYYLKEHPVDIEKYGRNEKCIACGKEFKSVLPLNRRQYCDKCLDAHIKEHENMVAEYAGLKIKIMHETAIRKMEKSKSVFNMRDYQDAIDAVKQMEEMKPECFLSASEIITAIVLYEADIFFKVNHKVGRYKIDFFLPEDFICLEVDSNLHDIGRTRAKDGKRDIEVREILGKEWETVRISSSRIDKYPTKIVDTMFEIAHKQRELRKKYHGMLPDNYSKATKAYYEEVLKY